MWLKVLILHKKQKVESHMYSEFHKAFKYIEYIKVSLFHYHFIMSYNNINN